MISPHDITAVVDRIVDLYDPDQVWLFGSHAKGNATESSDVDLLVVKPTELPRSMRGRDVVAVLSSTAFHLDVLFMTPQEVRDELAEPYSLVTTIMPTAKSVYERPS